MPSNFDIAPAPATVDGLLAVPIDIQTIDATLIFDGNTSSATGDATLTFVTGPVAGNPIFDLRQTITASWLDGLPLPVGQLAHHDFGGGPDAELRVLESVLTAGGTHTLRVTYTLGPPQASTAGSYPPGLTWSPGPRLAFNFGFTDLGAGRYLEAWVPANLIFDQFELRLELRVTNTAIPHTVITNGAVTTLGANHWRVEYPARFTALSPLLELRASDTLASLTGTTTLPVSGAAVTVEAWKLAASPVDLGARVADLKTWLAGNETEVGPYLHGNRFLAFVHTGGMEYEGGTTSGPGALRHETFHSWWARGVKPASQPDAWFDEAWTVYNDQGATGSLPFDFSDPPVTLCNRNPWSRVTEYPASYTSGELVFEGIAALASAPTLRSFMRQFYAGHTARPITTEDLETFLVSRSGHAELVDAFHRFVYGFADPSPAPDLWLRDDPAHTGTEAWAGRFWDSPDLWVRNADDGGTAHQAPEHGQDNWFHARVRNRGTGNARHFVVAFNVKPFAGVEFSYPADLFPGVAAVAGFELEPGESTVVKARWPADLVPPPGTHACWLAAVLSRGDHPVPGTHVWDQNSLAQKNLTVVDLAPDDWLVLPFIINRFPWQGRRGRSATLELVRPVGREKLEASIIRGLGRALPDLLDVLGVPLDRAGPTVPLRGEFIAAGPRYPKAEPVADFVAGPATPVRVELPNAGQLLLGLRLHVPPDAEPGETIALDLVHRGDDGKRILGGLAVQIRVRS